jgi:hypothetical protein
MGVYRGCIGDRMTSSACVSRWIPTEWFRKSASSETTDTKTDDASQVVE